jgi:hypothetical protein
MQRRGLAPSWPKKPPTPSLRATSVLIRMPWAKLTYGFHPSSFLAFSLEYFSRFHMAIAL